MTRLYSERSNSTFRLEAQHRNRVPMATRSLGSNAFSSRSGSLVGATPPRGTARRTRPFVAAFLLLLADLGCGLARGAGSDQEVAWQTYADQMQVRDWNRTLEVSIADAPSTAGSEGVIDLLVTNRSNEEVWFPPGYGAILLTYSEENLRWEEVKNRATYLGDGEIIEPRLSEASSWAAVTSVAPTLDTLGKPAMLRVLIVGRVVRDGAVTEEAVGGYIDVDLS